MPPRSSEQAPAHVVVLPPLPQDFVHAIFLLLGAADRGRAACVCRAWRAFVAAPTLWTTLRVEGHWIFATQLALAASKAARGGLRTLDLTGWFGWHADLPVYDGKWRFVESSIPSETPVTDALCAVIRDNRRALCELQMRCHPRAPGVACWQVQRFALAVAGSDSALRVWSADVDRCTPDEALLLLRNEPPFDHLRLHRLSVGKSSNDEDDVVPVTGAQLDAISAALSAHPSLQQLSLNFAQLDNRGALDAFVDAAVATRLPAVCFSSCSLFAHAVPSLARLLRGGALRTLRIVGDGLRSGVLLNEDNAASFSAALRDSVELRSLELDYSTGMWRSGAGIAVLQALAGHPTLEELSIPDCWALGTAAELSVALAALIAADAPALKRISVYSCDMDDRRGLEDEDERDIARVFDALSRNRHLESIDLRGPHVSAACAQQHVLPAVRACTTLRQLHVVSAHDAHLTAFGNRSDDEPVAPEYAEVFAIVRERADAPGLTSGTRARAYCHVCKALHVEDALSS